MANPNIIVPGLNTLAGTVEGINSSQASSVFSNNVRYVPCAHAASDYVEFQFTPLSTGKLNLTFLYSMSSSSGNNVRLRLDNFMVASGSDPTAAVTTGTAFTITPGSNTLLHAVTIAASSDLTLSVTAGQVVYCRLTRLGSDGADTHAGNMQIVAIEVN